MKIRCSLWLIPLSAACFSKRSHCKAFKRVPWHGGVTGTDYCRCRNRIFIWFVNPTLGNEKIYAVENPGYRKIGKIYQSYKVLCKYIDMDEEGVEISKLEENQVDIAHISPSHHYPTGIVMPVSRRYELLGWACKIRNRYIIEDDYDSELRLSVSRFQRCKAWMCLTKWFIWIPLQNTCVQPCVSAIWYFRENFFSSIIKTCRFILVRFLIWTVYAGKIYWRRLFWKAH